MLPATTTVLEPSLSTGAVGGDTRASCDKGTKEIRQKRVSYIVSSGKKGTLPVYVAHDVASEDDGTGAGLEHGGGERLPATTTALEPDLSTREAGGDARASGGNETKQNRAKMMVAYLYMSRTTLPATTAAMEPDLSKGKAGCGARASGGNETKKNRDEISELQHVVSKKLVTHPFMALRRGRSVLKRLARHGGPIQLRATARRYASSAPLLDNKQLGWVVVAERRFDGGGSSKGGGEGRESEEKERRGDPTGPTTRPTRSMHLASSEVAMSGVTFFSCHVKSLCFLKLKANLKHFSSMNSSHHTQPGQNSTPSPGTSVLRLSAKYYQVGELYKRSLIHLSSACPMELPFGPFSRHGMYKIPYGFRLLSSLATWGLTQCAIKVIGYIK
ncbi:hypothetical protein B0H11DRAFT_1910030 [Mycena galericulata]|nr:hypothetical protein B0H11DRAFT_1910030 [Mycena galericulata]